MRRDPIVEEVRRNRAAIAREHGNDLDAIVAAFQREEAASGVMPVSFPPRRFVKRTPRRKPGHARRSGKALPPTGRAVKTRRQAKGRKRAARH